MNAAGIRGQLNALLDEDRNPIASKLAPEVAELEDDVLPSARL